VNQPATEAAWQIQTLADSAKQLAERGEVREAEDIYRRILEAAPYHVRALNFLAVQAMLRGELEQSRVHLEQALRAAPDRAILHQNMALVQKERGELEDALLWLDRAIALKPSHRTPHLHKAAILMELGRQDAAISAYWHAWRRFPNPESAINDPAAPEGIRNLVLRAAESLRLAQAQIIAQTLAPVHEAHGAETLKRVDEMAEIYVGSRLYQPQHGLQRPGFLYMPGLPPRPFYERETFTGHKRLEAATDIIREELQAVMASGEGLMPYVQLPAGQDLQQWTELNGSRQWSSLHLYKGGAPVPGNLERCPRTAKVLETLDLAVLPGHSPEAMFSILQPGTHIPAHFGLANFKLAVHLPLIVPADCGIRVGHETRSWKEGECLVFDDSFQHEAWNRSGEARAVLILDVWNPDVTPAERAGIAAVVEGIAAFERKYGGAA